MSFRAIAKFGLVLVIIGFFMPIACNNDGFELAEKMMKLKDGKVNGILVYVMFISAIVGVLLGVMMLIGKGLGANIDWIVIITCIASGLIVYLSTALSDNNVKLQNGAYFILAGWIVSLGLQIFSTMKGES